MFLMHLRKNVKNHVTRGRDFHIFSTQVPWDAIKVNNKTDTFQKPTVAPLESSDAGMADSSHGRARRSVRRKKKSNAKHSEAISLHIMMSLSVFAHLPSSFGPTFGNVISDTKDWTWS
jgi:hypothetical protein